MTQKKRVTIYIDSDLWEVVKMESRNRSASIGKDISASQLAEDAMRGFLSILPGVTIPPAPEPKSAADSESDDRTEAEILADGQAKLEANRKEHEKGPVKVAKIKSLTGYSGARPKGTK